MNQYFFESIEEIPLPNIIKESFVDEYEKAHLRHYEEHVYLILNYPLTPQTRVTCCLLAGINDLTLFAPLSLKSKVIHSHTLSELLLSMVNQYEAQTKMISDEVDEFEKIMESLVDRSHVTKLYQTQKDIIYIQSGVLAIERILNTIQSTQAIGLYNPKDSTDYASIIIETQQTLETLRMQQQMIDSLMQSSESLFSNKLNETMKRLTSITLIFSFPIFITGFFGMNIAIPGQEHPYILLIILGGSTFLTWWLTLYLRKKDLL